MAPRPHPAPVARPLALLVLGLALSWPLRAQSSQQSAVDPWQDALRFEFGPAAEELSRRHAAADDSRIAFALASALLGRQPRTQANILEARRILEQVAAKPPADSTFTLAARLFLGRIAEEHLSPARPEEARERYEALLREHAGQPLADQAAIHLALLAAYPPPGASPLPSDALQARIDELRAAVRTPGVVRELHALQGSLLLEKKALAAALPHFLAARAIGYRRHNRNAEADLTIANIARETGARDLAIEHYRAFLAGRPRDARTTTVRRYIAELESTGAQTPAP